MGLSSTLPSTLSQAKLNVFQKILIQLGRWILMCKAMQNSFRVMLSSEICPLQTFVISKNKTPATTGISLF